MSNPKMLVDKIKNLMVEFGFAAESEELMSFSIEDENNTILQVSKLEVGNSIMKINDEFNQVSLEDGSYKLKENFEIQVLNGKIMSVKEIFIDAKLVDGTVVKVEGDSLVEGAKVVVVTADAEVPAPDGVHELEDGTKIETKEGVIARVEEKVAEMEEGVDAMGKKMIDKPEQMSVEADEIIYLLKELVAGLEAKYKVVEEEVESMKAELNAFKKQPASAPIKNGKTDFNKQNNNDLVSARVAAILSQKNK
jgi:hypothetical protein